MWFFVCATVRETHFSTWDFINALSSLCTSYIKPKFTSDLAYLLGWRMCSHKALSRQNIFRQLLIEWVCHSWLRYIISHWVSRVLKYPKKCLGGFDSIFHVYLMRGFQKHGRNWILTMAFWATCKIAQPIQPIWEHIFALP